MASRLSEQPRSFAVVHHARQPIVLPSIKKKKPPVRPGDKTYEQQMEEFYKKKNGTGITIQQQQEVLDEF